MLDRDGSKVRSGNSTDQSSSGFGLYSGSVELQGFPSYQQPDDYTCGPTCCQMVLGYFGKTAGIGPLTTACGTYWWSLPNGKRFGMSHPDKVASAFSGYGINASKTRGDTDSLIHYVTMRQPPILLVRSGNSTMHYIAVVGCFSDGSKFKIADPSSNKARWIGASKLQAAWQFSADLEGNAVGGRQCISCKGDGKVWTNCVTCGGSGKWKAFGGWTKCATCSGQGKYSGKCLYCGGDGRETDAMRKAIETMGIQGRTLIYPRRRGGLNDPVPGEPKVSIQYSLYNDSGRKVEFRLPSGRNYVLENGKKESYQNTGSVSALKIIVNSTGKKYSLTSGNHKFWWMRHEQRVGLDLNFDE